MVIKPIAFVAVAAALVAAAGIGAYVAVRQNTIEGPVEAVEIAAEPSPLSTLAGATTEMGEKLVNTTEAVVDARQPRPEPVPDSVIPAARPAAATQTARQQSRVPATTRRAEPEPQVSSTPVSEKTAPEASVPEWGKLDESWPRREPAREADVALVSLDNGAVGTRLDPEAQPPIIEEVVVSADSVIGLQVETPVSTEDAKVEDRVEARVIRDVTVGDRIAIPAGTRMIGSVVLVEQGGKVKEVARLGVRFHTLVLDEGVEVRVATETVYREGKSPAGESAAKIGGAAVGGAILGAIFGGTRGAVIGGSAGAAGGTAAVMASDRNPATLPAGSTVTVRLSEPATVPVEQ